MIQILSHKLAWLRLVCILLAASFGTLSPVGAVDRTAVAGVDLSAYTLPDGSLPVICFGNGQPVDETGSHCDSCLTFAPFALTAHQSSLKAFTVQTSAQRLQISAFAASLYRTKSNPTRGPPLA